MQKRQGIIWILIISLITNLMMPITVSSATIRPYGLKVAAGQSHTLIIDDQGNVWAFGDNSSGQIGDGSTVSRDRAVQVYNNQWEGKAVSVAAGSKQSLVLLENGTVLQWGYNNFSLPIQKKVTLNGKVLDIVAAQDLCMAIIQRSSGSIQAVAWSNLITETNIKTEQGENFSGVKQISAGSNNFAVLLDDAGKAYEIDTQFRAIPINILPTSELSNGLSRLLTLFQDVDPATSEDPAATATPTLEPTATVASTPTTAPTLTPTTAPTLTPTTAPTLSPSPSPTPTPQPLTGIVEVSAGAEFGVALTASGDVYTWGNPRNGVLGYTATNYSAQAKKVSLPSPVRRISAGSEHVIAILENNNVYAWGKRDASGMTGTGSTETPTRITTGAGAIAQISSSTYHNVALNGSNQYFVWGNTATTGQIKLQEYLVLSEDPAIAASTIGDTYMTISWNPDDFYTDMMLGFEVEYVLPGGTGSKSQLLPITQSQISFRSLQPETNHTIRVTAYGKTGFTQTVPEIVVTTLELDEEEITPTPSPTVDATATPEPTETLTPTEGVDPEDQDDEGISIFGILLIILAVLILIAAVFAIVFVWKKIDNDDGPKIKPVRIAPVKEDDNSVNALWNDIEPDKEEDQSVADDDFLTKPPKTHEFEEENENGDKKE